MASEEQIDKHRRQVIELSKVGQPVNRRAATATIHNPKWFRMPFGDLNQLRAAPARRRMHQRMVGELIEASPNARQERKAIVMAGPPGAGKSTLRNRLLGQREHDYLRVDADDFKDKLLHEAIADGSYESFIKPNIVKELEQNGEEFFPMELASLVHEESTTIASLAREQAVASGTNVIIDTVLSSQETAERLLDELSSAGYEVEIIDVEVPYEISEARIAQRWRETYVNAVERRGDSLGGRWVPSEYTHDVFAGPRGTSKPEAIAASLARLFPAVTRYRLWRTTEMETADTPAKGDWESDLTRAHEGGPLFPTRQAGSAPTSAEQRPEFP